MSTKTGQEKIEGRFDKVLSYYWDGVPVPLLYNTEKLCTQTFICRQLAFTPDYHGETVSVSLTEPTQTTLFSSLATQTTGPQPASCRIGSHYSLYVGLFRFFEAKHSSNAVMSGEKPFVRVPVEYCERKEECSGEVYTLHCRIRTGKLVALYKPLIKEHLPLGRNSLRKIIVLSSRGCTSVSREIIAREISDVNEEYANAMSEAIFFYMCLNPLQRRLLEPLQLATEPEIPKQCIQRHFSSDRKTSHQHFSDAKQQLKRQLLWSPTTRGYFVALQSLWEQKFDRLFFFDTETFSGVVDVAPFISQMTNSISAVISRIRIEFYANVEESFFSLIPFAKEALFLSEAEYEESVFSHVFLATEVFLVNKMRNLVFAALDSVISYFDCDDFGTALRLAKPAKRQSFIRIDMLASELFQPRAPAMAALLFGVRDLFAEVEFSVNNLPGVGSVLLRTLRLEEKKISVISHVEIASYRAAVAGLLNNVALVVDELLSAYNEFCTIPVQNLAIVKAGSVAEVAKHVIFARQQVTDIYRASHRQMYCGRFAICSAALQDALVSEWENYTAALTSAFQTTIVSVVNDAKTRSAVILKVFDTIPSNVVQLEAHLQNTEAAKVLAEELRSIDCKDILARVACMEELYVPIEQHVCDAVFEFKKLPDELLSGAAKAADVRARCAPLLRRRLVHLRTSTREYMQTLSTGVTELYHLFNLETCDIAAQTCAELRELVDRIDSNLKKITHEEEVLGIQAEDTFDAFPSLLHYFEVIEQFWNSIFDATKLRDMYNSSIGSVNAAASVDRVREWRRLIHSSTRHLRGFPSLVQLGREQEVALSKYEELGLFLEIISSQNLRKNHWKDIAKLIAAQLREDVASVMDLTITVKRLIDAGLMEHMSALGQIANQAQCDYEVESALEEMRSYGKRTHFAFSDSHDGGASRSCVAPSFIREAAGHVEQFMIRCRAMRRLPNVGQLVRKPLLEWEAACEKSLDMLAVFDMTQENVAWVENCLQTVRMTPAAAKANPDGRRETLIQLLSIASDSMKRLHTTLRKPQFSLYTAIIQDTVQDAFLAVKTAVDEVLQVLRQHLDQRRAAFPRFHFLSDSQLVCFQYVLVPASFVPLFPYLYARLADVETVDGDVTAVVAVDGATLTLSTPMSLTTAYPDVWMAQFGDAMRSSLLAAVKNCVAALYSMDLESWVSGWSGQVVVLAMRILHTEGLRRAVQIGGADALQAYATNISDKCCALSHLALQLNERRTRVNADDDGIAATVKAAFAYGQYAMQETKLAIEWGIRSVAELDCTQLLQTSFTPSGDGIQVSFLGVSTHHGLEFLGNGSAPFLGSAQWKQIAMVLADVELGRSVPLAYGEDSAEVSDSLLKVAAQVLGRFFLRVELTSHTITETLAPLLRGCVETGAFLCLANCETMSVKLLSDCVLPLVNAYRTTTPSPTWELPYGPLGAVVAVPVHPLFRLAFCSRRPGACPLQLTTLCEAVRVAPLNIAELLHSLLTQAGIISLAPLSVEELELAELYEQLHERVPEIFTMRQLQVIIRDIIARGIETPRHRSDNAHQPSQLLLIQHFLDSLMRTSCSVFQSDEGVALHRSLVEQIKARLLLSSCKGVVPRELFAELPLDGSQAMLDELAQRFASLIEVHRRVLILGPHFSGKTQIWRHWLGDSLPLILSPQHLTAASFYGNEARRGFLSQIGSQITLTNTTKRTPVVVLEGVDAPPSFELFTESWFDGARTPEGAASGTSMVAPRLLAVIATALQIRHLTPGVMDGFAMLALTEPASWKCALKWALSYIPEWAAASKVLEVLLPPLVERASRISPDIVGSANELANMCSIAHRAASLCSRWYAYALSVRTHSDVLAPLDDGDEVDLGLFAARCAVMAASWSVGLSLPVEERDAVKLTLLSAEADVVKALAGMRLSGEVFPQLTHNSISPLEQVVLPQGWTSLDEAAKRTDLPLSWADYRQVNPQLQVPLQAFATPSRVTTLRLVECLMNCGQHILMHGGAVNGKTTLLHTMRTCENWVTQVFRLNAGFNATEMQQKMATTLSKRSSGHYGPLLGRRLVVCVDDLHLSPVSTLDNQAPLAGGFMRLCEKFRAISTPALGTIPTTDVVFCATTLLQQTPPLDRCSVGASSGCVDVLLPPFNGDEMAIGLFQVCEAASSRKRAKCFAQDCTSFLDLVHGAYCQLRQRSVLLVNFPTSTPMTLSPQAIDRPRPPSAVLPAEAQEEGTGEAVATTFRSSGASFYTEHFRDLLEAAEVVRLHLLSTVSDSQVAARVFIGVTTFYDERLSPSANISSPSAAAVAAGQQSEATKERDSQQASREFRNAVVQAAQGTLRNSVRGNVEFGDLAHELPEAFRRDSVSHADEARVAQRIVTFESVLRDEEETSVAKLGDRHKSSSAKEVQSGCATVRTETLQTSVVFCYPDSLRAAAVRAEGVNREVYVRRASSAVGGGTKSSQRVLSASSALSDTSSLGSQHAPTRMETQTYQTTWLTTRFVHLEDTLSAPESHLLLLGDNTFGLRRLFRLWCATTHVPFIWFRVNDARPHRDICNTFFAELRATIVYVCRKSVHAVAYVPPSLLRTPEVLLALDALVRCGDVSSLFTDEERYALLCGPHATRSRSLKPFVFADDSELRERVRGSMNFVFHLRDATEARELGKGFPFLRQPFTTPLPLYTRELEESLREEIALGILHSTDFSSDGIHKMEDEGDSSTVATPTRGTEVDEAELDCNRTSLSPRVACVALCTMFDYVCQQHPTPVEQFIAFVRLYKELDDTARVQVLASARTGRVIADRGDAAVQAVSAVAQRNREIVEELAAVQLKLALLTEKLSGQERQRALRAAEAERCRVAVEDARAAITRRQETTEKTLEEVKDGVAKAMKQLRKAKPGAVRALGSSRVSDKGPLLVRALYAVLGEEVPKHSDNASELWTLSMKRMCTKEFATELVAVSPESGADRLPALLPFRRELDVIRYAPALPHAQVLADFVLAWVDCAKYVTEDYPAELAAVLDAQQAVERDEAVYREKKEEVVSAERASVQTSTEVAALQNSLAVLRKEQDGLSGSEGRLLKYTGLVDRFTRFLVGPASVPHRLRHARCATGDTLIVAAFYTLVAMHEDARSMIAGLQELLTKTVHGVPLQFSPVQEACAQLLYQTHAPKTEALTALGCDVPWEYKVLLWTLYQRRASRWTLVGGAGPIIAHGLMNFLAYCCTDSVSISAVDPLAKERLVAAMRAGTGVLLRDVHSAATLDLARSLNFVYQRLKSYHAHLRRMQRMPKESGAAPSAQSAVKRAAARLTRGEATRPVLSVWFDGQEVRVHPQFFVVCTCFPVVTSCLPEACESLDVFNLYTPLRSSARLSWLLCAAVKKPSVSTKIASMQEEVHTRQQVYFEVLHEFMESHDSAAALLATDLSDISGSSRGDALLTEMEQALARVEMYDGQMAQTASYVQSLQRTVQEGWDAILPAIEAVTKVAEHIEVARLGRPWSPSGLDSCIGDISEPSAALVRRIAPLSFSELPIGQKCYYALTHYIQRVVELLAPGWPTQLKGLYSLSMVCVAMAAAPEAFEVESKLPMLTGEQRRVLAALMYGEHSLETAEKVSGTESKASAANAPAAQLGAEAQNQRTHTLRQLFATSRDAVLRRLVGVAGDDIPEDSEADFADGGQTEFYVTQLFAALLTLDVEVASSCASHLFNAFVNAVTGFQKAPERSTPRTAERVSLSEGPRSRATFLTGCSAFDSGAEEDPRRALGVNRLDENLESSMDFLTINTQIERSLKARLPLCFLAEGKVEDALMWLQSEVRETKWVFQWRELTPPSPEAFSYDLQLQADATDSACWRAAVLQSFGEAREHIVALSRASCAPDTCGVFLTLVVDAPEDADLSGIAKSDVLLFQEEWQRLLALCASLPPRPGGSASTVCLALVCSSAAQPLCWRQPAANVSVSRRDAHDGTFYTMVPCCYFSLASYTPQLALFELLRPTRCLFTSSGVLPVCDAVLVQVQSELQARKGTETVSDKRPTRVRGPALAKESALRTKVGLGVALPKLPENLSVAALVTLKRIMTELRSSARLLLYETIVSYVASTTRLHLLYAADAFAQASTASAAIAAAAKEGQLRRYVYDPAPLLHLHSLLASWVRQRYADLVAQLSGTPSAAAPTAKPAPGPPPAASPTARNAAVQGRSFSALPVPIRVVTHRDSTDEHTHNYGMQAYYYLRRNQPAWALLLQKARQNLSAAAAVQAGPAASVEASAELFNHAICSVMCARSTFAPNGDSVKSGVRSTASSLDRRANVAAQAVQHQHMDLIEEAGAEWGTGLFVMARKFAFHYLCSRLERRSVGTAKCALPLLEQRAQWDLISAFIGAAGEAEEVSFLWGSLVDGGAATRQCYELRLNVSHLDAFRATVSDAPTDLMELCGEAEATQYFRKVRREILLRLCFSNTVLAADVAGGLAGVVDSKVDTAGRLGARVGMQPEAAFAMAALRDACEDAHGRPSSSLTLAEAVVEWECVSFETCAHHHGPALQGSFIRMLRSFASAIASKKGSGADHTAVPENQHLHLWLPALQHPLFDLHYLASAVLQGPPNVLAKSGAPLSPRMQSVIRSRDDPFADMPFGNNEDELFIGARRCGGVATALVVVVTQQRFLTAFDVVLCGARLSPLLQQQVREMTGWAERGPSGDDDGGQAASAPGSSAEDEVVVVMRIVLLRRSRATTGVVSEVDNFSEVRSGLDRRRMLEVELGMYVRRADRSQPGLIWRNALFPQVVVAGVLWDTRPTCRPAYTALVSRSPSATRTGSFVPEEGHTSDGFFVTEGGDSVRDRAGRSAAVGGGASDNSSVTHTWSFSDAPVPVHWGSISNNGELCMVEFPLCIEYELQADGNAASQFACVAEGPLHAGTASSGDEVVVDVLPIRDALKTYLWIE